MSKDLLKEVRDGVEAMIAENKKYWDENKTVPSHAEYKRESIQIPKSEARVEPHDAQQQKRNRMSYKHAEQDGKIYQSSRGNAYLVDEYNFVDSAAELYEIRVAPEDVKLFNQVADSIRYMYLSSNYKFPLGDIGVAGTNSRRIFSFPLWDSVSGEIDFKNTKEGEDFWRYVLNPNNAAKNYLSYVKYIRQALRPNNGGSVHTIRVYDYKHYGRPVTINYVTQFSHANEYDSLYIFGVSKFDLSNLSMEQACIIECDDIATPIILGNNINDTRVFIGEKDAYTWELFMEPRKLAEFLNKGRGKTIEVEYEY